MLHRDRPLKLLSISSGLFKICDAAQAAGDSGRVRFVGCSGCNQRAALNAISSNSLRGASRSRGSSLNANPQPSTQAFQHTQAPLSDSPVQPSFPSFHIKVVGISRCHSFITPKHLLQHLGFLKAKWHCLTSEVFPSARHRKSCAFMSVIPARITNPTKCNKRQRDRNTAPPPKTFS